MVSYNIYDIWPRCLYTHPDFFLSSFYFQTVEGFDTTSGARFILLLVSQILALIITGAVVSKWGYYV